MKLVVVHKKDNLIQNEFVKTNICMHVDLTYIGDWAERDNV